MLTGYALRVLACAELPDLPMPSTHNRDNNKYALDTCSTLATIGDEGNPIYAYVTRLPTRKCICVVYIILFTYTVYVRDQLIAILEQTTAFPPYKNFKFQHFGVCKGNPNNYD